MEGLSFSMGFLVLFPADYSSFIFYIYFLSTSAIIFFCAFDASAVADYSKGRVENARGRYVLVIIKNVLVMRMNLLICKSTFHYQKDIFFVLERDVLERDE